MSSSNLITHMISKSIFVSAFDLQRHNPDVLCLQECGEIPRLGGNKNKLKEESDYKYMASNGSNAIFSKNEILEM